MHYADRVQETTATTGTGTVTLAGAVSGYRAFSAAFTNGDTVRYAISFGAEWEVGEGVYSAGTLTRASVFASSNANALVSFSAGSKAVWCDIPAATLANLGSAASGAALYRDASGNVAGSAVVSVAEASQQLVLTAENLAGSGNLFALNYEDTASGAAVFCRKARGTLAAPLSTQASDLLGSYAAQGYHADGTPGFGPANASLRLHAEENFTATEQGMYCILRLPKIGTTTVAEVFRCNGNGFVTITAKTAATGSIPMFKATAAAHTGQTASTELHIALWDMSATLQFATGALTTERAFLVKAPTFAFVGASVITNAATLAIDRAPQAGTNGTITNSYAFWVQAGLSKFDGAISTSGLTCTGSTIEIYNPAGTFKYTIAAAAIAADRVLSYPLLTSNDTFVTAAFGQTLTNKTINGASNTLTVRLANDVSGTLPVANGGTGNQGGIVNDSASTGTVNDLAVAISTRAIRFTNATPPTITGFAVAGGNVAGTQIRIVATSGNITLKSDNAGSTVANRIKTNAGADVTVLQYEYMELVYDGGQARWLRVS